MANAVQHAQNSEARTYDAVRVYMPGLLPRLAFNYAVLFALVFMVSLVGVPLLRQIIFESTSVIAGFAANVLILVYGSRWLEQRNPATTLFVLYTRFSRQRRDLRKLLQQVNTPAAPSDQDLYVKVDRMEEFARQFIAAAQDQGIKPGA
jgi:hypothetical protein